MMPYLGLRAQSKSNEFADEASLPVELTSTKKKKEQLF